MPRLSLLVPFPVTKYFHIPPAWPLDSSSLLVRQRQRILLNQQFQVKMFIEAMGVANME
jgi:hypothetical protein